MRCWPRNLGLPKFVTPIDYGRVDQQVDIVLFDPAQPQRRDQAIFCAWGPPGGPVPGPTLSPLLYRRWASVGLKTTVNARGGGRVHAGHGLQLRLGPSQHLDGSDPACPGAEGAHPGWCWTQTSFQSCLNDGQEMPDPI